MYEVHRIDVYTDLSVNVTVCSGVKKTRDSTFHWQVLHGSWPAPEMVVERIGLYVEDILVSLVFSIIISWIFRILAHEENQYNYVYKISVHFLSKALKQNKAGPRSSGTPFLVILIFI